MRESIFKSLEDGLLKNSCRLAGQLPHRQVSFLTSLSRIMQSGSSLSVFVV